LSEKIIDLLQIVIIPPAVGLGLDILFVSLARLVAGKGKSTEAKAS
jgi:hypothetical protein